MSPPFRELSEAEDKEMVDQINASGADIIWVGLGAPKQEKWMYAHKNHVNGVMIGVGAGFDYHAGNIKRAPGWMQKLSLEWYIVCCRIRRDCLNVIWSRIHVICG